MIIGISGKKQSGKDTIGKIINILVSSPQLNNEGVATFLRKDIGQSHFVVKKFADKLKDMVCMLIGCTREQLEDETFKNTELGEEWWYFKGRNGSLIPYSEDSKRNEEDLIKPTPRFLLQFIGTDLLRNQLHPEIWVNSLFTDYQPNNLIYPSWCITDMRFLNEMEAVKKRKGITIRVNRNLGESKDQHESETELDNAEFDYVINNDGTIEELIEKVREILTKEKLI